MTTNGTSRSVSLAPTFLGVAIAMLVVAAVLIVGLAVRPAGGLAVPTGAHVMHVQEFDYGFRMPTTPIPAGQLIIVDKNVGKIPHELVMFKTESATAPLPLRKNGEVDEESSKLEDVIDSGSALAPGETRILTATLDPGTYVIVCNLPLHYGFGMHQLITVAAG